MAASTQSVTMTAAEAEKELYDAALEGDLAKPLQLLQGHPCLFDVVSFAGSRNLLHIATLAGKEDIVEEVLKVKPELAQNVDSQNSSPLHIAAAQGNVAIARKLLAEAPEMLFCRDSQGMNPFHVAAMRGENDFLEEVVQDNTLLAAMERLSHGETVLHLCVKHRQFEVLKVLVKKLGQPYVEAKDRNGDTILDSAVRSNQVDMIKYLVSKDTGINKTKMNFMKRTALDVLKQSPTQTTAATSSDIKKLLRSSSLFRRVAIEEIREMRSALMVVAVLTATIAFQSAISPPGGVWQVNGVWDAYYGSNRVAYYAGDAVMASTHPVEYKVFLAANAGAFFVSVLTIILLAVGTRYQGFSSPYILFLLVVVTQFLMLLSYIQSLNATTPIREGRFLADLQLITTMVFVGLPLVLLISQLLFHYTSVQALLETINRLRA